MNLPDALHDLAAGEAASPPDLAERALSRARTRAHRKGALAVAGAALAVVLVVGAVLTSLNGTADRSTSTPPAADTTSVLDQPRVNVLLLGSDEAPERIGVRSDTVIVASIDTRSGATVLFGLPRNLEHLPFPPGTPQARAFPDGYVCPHHECMLNGLWQWAENDGAKYYPGAGSPGLTATKEGVEQATGLAVDETAVMTMKGLQTLVDAVGGVDVTVNERLPIGGSAANPSPRGWLEKGRQHLDGYQALWYARSRWSTNDYSRMARQQCLLTALVDQVDAESLVRGYPKLMGALRDVRTSIRPADLTDWARLATRMKTGGVTRVAIIPPDRTNPDYDAVRQEVRAVLGGQEAKKTGYEEPC